MIALYRPGTSWIHAMATGPKLFAVMAVAVAAGLTVNNPWSLAVGAALVLAGYLLARLGVGELARQVVAVRWVIVVMLATQLVFLPAAVALANVGRVTTVIVLAALITLTTRTTDLLDTVERALAPFRRFGVNPAKIGLLLALTITAIPQITGFAAAIREAQHARGAPMRIGTIVVPLLVMSLKHSDELADALIARGVE